MIWEPDRMVYGSLFSGAGGSDLGFHRAGWRPAFFCEKEAYRRRVLRRHWPDVRCFEDVLEVNAKTAKRVKGLAGGFPCQDVSVAGKRKGLDGDRSGLFFEFARVAGELVRPGGWIVIENVPGLLSSNGGRDFAVVVRTLGELGFHDLCWRVLDSRYFGVPQRRRRVFVVGRRACGECSQAVLLEREGCGWDFAEGGPSWARVAGGARAGVATAGTVRSHVRPGSNDSGGIVAAPLTKGSAAGKGVSYPGRRKEDDENLVPYGVVGEEVTQALTTRFGTNTGVDYADAEAGWLVETEEVELANTLKASSGKGRGWGTGPEENYVVDGEVAPPVTAKWAKGSGGPSGDECQNLLMFEKSHRSVDKDDPEKWREAEVAPTLNDHDLGNEIRATALVSEDEPEPPRTRAFHAYHGYEQEDAVQTLLGGASGGCLSLHDAPILLTEEQQQAFNLMPESGQGADMKVTATDEATGVGASYHKLTDRGTRVVEGGGIRRLTPTECERLQSLPDGWTYPVGPSLADVPSEPVPAVVGVGSASPVDYTPDGPRYAACGDAVTANVAEWLADRISRVREMA